MKEIVVAGVGMHPMGRFPDKSYAELAEVAIINALNDAGIKNVKDIPIAFFGHVYGGMGVAVHCCDRVGIAGIPMVVCEQACSSGLLALKLGYWALLAEQYDIALAVGVEKLPRGMLRIGDVLLSPWFYYLGQMGLSPMPMVAAWDQKRYMKKYGATREQIAQVAVIAHRNGMLNPNAQHQKELTLEEVLNSRMICDPVTLYQCCPTTDGAAAAVICTREKAGQLNGNKPITIAAIPHTTPKATKTRSLTDREGIAKVSTEAYEKAGIGPEDVDVVQLHDPFTIMAVEILEALGLCPEGEGARYYWEGKTEINGDIPVNTDGGTQARGHPLGATGIAEVAEITSQLRGQAGPRQVSGAKVGLTYNQGLGGEMVCILKA